jgi:hypothetical protein
MNFPIGLTHVLTVPLRHDGDCSIVGITPEGTVYVEEIYGEDGWVALHKISSDGSIKASADEESGANIPLTPLAVPLDLSKPTRVWNTMSLNYAGARHRGLRGLERVDELARTLAIVEKLALIKHLNLDILPPQLLGLVESYVLAEAEVVHPHLFFVCRRARVAYVLPSERADVNGNPYDYDTQAFYGVHFYNRSSDDDPPMTDMLEGLPGVTLSRPMDCMIWGNRLYVADGGDPDIERICHLHVWTLDLPETESPDDEWHRKLYG